ncbi:unnamed protein product [Bursaphelenchus xylophilus]|uniref:Hexosyltransferase n=1 Tax=Bursaphelenchus xylophilus TaxID=6326 RepID=A0A1I7S568_BURXY|nr:unnamed protein product [Bursaphelenchus xylophilus]CAG9117760.1 unnamed protein product [Bursaphelenchus xylophilus]
MTVPKEKICENSTIFVAIMSTGAKSAHVQRDALRGAFLKKATNLHVVYKFFIGHSNESRPDLLAKEVKAYDDIVFINTMDTYANNTVKWNAMHQYHQKYCKDAFFFMKIDDDVVVHFERLLYWIEHDFGGLTKGQNDWLLCQKIHGVQPVRDPKNKWFVPKTQFAKDWYPPYCNGYAVLMPSQTATKIFEDMKNHNFMKMDDVFFTGIVTESLNITVNGFAGISYDFDIDMCVGDPPVNTIIHSEHRPKTVYVKYYKLERCSEIAKQLGNSTVVPNVDYES